jgi:hypothetical protein
MPLNLPERVYVDEEAFNRVKAFFRGPGQAPAPSLMSRLRRAVSQWIH